MLFSTYNADKFIILVSMFLYIISYIVLLKQFNAAPWRIIYTMLGLYAITNIVHVFIDPIVISSIVSISIIFVIVIVLYLLDIENKITSVIISLCILVPYYSLINFLTPNFTELMLFPIIPYTILLVELIKFDNNTSKTLALIIPLSIISLFFVSLTDGTDSLIFDIILGALFIVYGALRKCSPLIYLVIALILVVLFIKLYMVISNLGVVIGLIILGFVLIGLAVFLSLRKKD